ncbi:hypothetical protein QAD02_018298 [Eretmocerus hayati]|uniref:Uncharacterized protein n=1 Tax=Eretmocerus hayati TaxID=131215 RepID=A0ACC2PGA6_9HYME|nr:hypothetical protein QAD02_018298 [Eretmocerus hayati]
MWLTLPILAINIFIASPVWTRPEIAAESTSLVSLEDGNGKHFCTGTAISEYKVITSASCLKSAPSNIKVREGTTTDGHSRFIHSVSSICVHAKFNKQEAHANDIGIIKLSDPFKFSNQFVPAKLAYATPENLKFMKYAEISGFSLGDNSEVNGIEAAFLPLVNDSYCIETHAGVEKHLGIASDQICVGWNVIGPCAGDAGAPLFYEGDLFAFVSHWQWGEDCDLIEAPAVFTLISHHRNWIDALLNDFDKSKKNKILAQCLPREVKKPPPPQVDPWYLRIMNGLLGD